MCLPSTLATPSSWNDRKSLMFHEYATDMSGFGEGNVALMRAVIAHGPRRDAELASTLVKTLEGSGTWDPAEKKEQLERLRAVKPEKPAAVPKDLEPLKPEDREILIEASARFEQGEVKGAWQRATPLFEAYPDALAVQDLRCKLATKLYDWTTARKQCQRVFDLTMQPR
jgi:hypothetical protein